MIKELGDLTAFDPDHLSEDRLLIEAHLGIAAKGGLALGPFCLVRSVASGIVENVPAI